MALWRADDVVAGEFEPVHDSAPITRAEEADGTDLTLVGDSLVLSSSGRALRSDDGRTWSEATTWR